MVSGWFGKSAVVGTRTSLSLSLFLLYIFPGALPKPELRPLSGLIKKSYFLRGGRKPNCHSPTAHHLVKEPVDLMTCISRLWFAVVYDSKVQTAKSKKKKTLFQDPATSEPGCAGPKFLSLPN